MAQHTLQTFEGNLAEYFRERLASCTQSLRPKPQQETLWYMGALLARLGDSQQLFCYEDGRLSLRPLAVLYKDAHDAPTGQERCLILRQLGDQALFVGALFPERYQRKGLKQDYFIGMGGGAYDYLADHADTHRSIFAELAEHFAVFLHLIAEVCSRQIHQNADDIMRLYQQWRSSGNRYAANQLRALGISLDEGQGVH
ncbi:hypothetical protein [Permianibacter aggregans]|uniref:Uncharacterized protein n=1 Tax=Permianibacter aggregans TaxID=1510150 RepID=A0A4R6UMB2_9GAMM|nr:hypothetical protein [Permianibacter aggregans]TDQ48051.1 hypothetical protein EV696_10831 [Permianibacter aggregans]